MSSDAYQPFISQYLLAVQTSSQQSYQDALETVLSCSKIGEKKKHYSKLAQALATLCRFQPDKGLVENVLPCLRFSLSFSCASLFLLRSPFSRRRSSGLKRRRIQRQGHPSPRLLPSQRARALAQERGPLLLSFFGFRSGEIDRERWGNRRSLATS